MAQTLTTGDVRGLATALPEVTEKERFRFKVPLWRRGRGLG